MTLPGGFHAVPAGWLATTVTHLEMRAAPLDDAAAFPEGLVPEHRERPATDWYRALFRKVGGDWLWTSRLQMAEPALAAILADPAVEVWTLPDGGDDAAICELDFRTPGACELAFFGLAAGLQGRGLARPLMAHAARRAWARDIARFHVHTCTHDHPAALPFYIRAGFVPVRREVEVMPDPRLSGLLPRDAALHVPLIPPAAMDADVGSR